MKKIDKKIVLITITIVYFIISLSTYINFGYKDIVIKNIGKNSSYSLGNEVYINYIAFDDIKIKNTSFLGNYEKNNDYNIKLLEKDKVVIKAPIFSRVVISFRRTSNSGYVEVKDINKTRTINLVGKNEDVVCHLSSTKLIYYFIYIMVIIILFIFLYKLISYLTRFKKIKRILNNNIIWILLVSIATRILFLKYFKTFYMVFPDTPTYEDYDLRTRTPIYPLVFKICELLTNSQISKYYLIIILQMIIGLISVYVFFKILNDITTKKTTTIITLVFSNLSYLIYFEHALLTETLSVLLILLCIRSIQLYLKNNNLKNAVTITILVIISVFLRPAFIYLIPLVLVFIIIYGIVNKKYKTIKYSLLMLVPSILVLIYCLFYYNRMGIFDFTCVPTLYNKAYNTTTYNYYDGTKYLQIEDSVTRNKIKTNNNHWSYVYKEFNKYGSKYIYFINDSISINKKEYINNIINKFVNYFGKTAVTNNISYYDKKNYNNHQYEISEKRLYIEIINNYLLFPFTYGFIIIFSFISLLESIIRWVKQKKVNWLKIGISLVIIMNLFVSFVNAIDDFERLTICVIPCVYLLIGIWVNDIFDIKNNNY